MTDETYNGYTNCETWAVKLHIDNNYEWHYTSLHLAASAQAEANAGTWIDGLREPIMREPEHILADQLKNWIETKVDAFWQAMMDGCDMRESKDVALMVQDVGSFWRVNWAEIANNLLEEV